MPSAEQALNAARLCELQGDRHGAIHAYQALLTWVPDHPGAHLRLAQFARANPSDNSSNDDQDAAVRAHFALAIQGATRLGLRADSAPIYAEFSAHLRDQNDGTAALQIAHTGLQYCGEIAGLIWEECECLRLLNETHARVRRLNRLALLQPNDAVVLTELGLALLATASAPQALKPLREAMLLGMNQPEVVLSLATLELHVGETQAATIRLQGLLENAPNSVGVLGALWLAYKKQCRWHESAVIETNLLRLLAAGESHPVLTPFMLLNSAISPQALRDYAVKLVQPSNTPCAPQGAPRAYPHAAARGGGKIRVGYVSSDFHHHATAILMAGLFELHSAHKFEVFAYSYGPRVDDAYRQRLKAAIGHWRDLNELTDRDAAALIYADDIDVLVELKGLTYGARSGIAAQRPARVVLHYLGYPGTLGGANADFLVADDVLVPVAHEPYYAEKIIRLPGCYQVNDHQRERPNPALRSDVGFAENALILCNFNQAVKWSEPFVNLWLQALQRAPNVWLWLLDPGSEARQEIVNRAAALGVAERVVWAPSLPTTEHLARLSVADLALDQLPYSSHTTGADALWMGVPLLTCLGDAFHGRVGASLLHATQLETFITADIAAYALRLHELIDNPALLHAAKAHLRNPRAVLDLFDTQKFVTAWEAMLTELHQSHADPSMA